MFSLQTLTTTHPKKGAAEARALLALATPLVLTQLAQMAVLTTDSVFLGRLSTRALAAAAIGNIFYFIIWFMGSGPAQIVATLVAYQHGSDPGDRTEIRHIVRMGLWSVVLLSAPLSLLLFFTQPLLIALGQEALLAAEAGRFTAMLCFGLPFAVGFQILRNFATALGYPRLALWVVLLVILWNAGVGYILIFGAFGLPGWGIIGAGLATSSSSIFGFFALLATIQLTRPLAAYRILHQLRHPLWPLFWEILRIGMPISFAIILEAGLFYSMTLIMGFFGTESVAAHQIALSFSSITFNIPVGIGMAAMVRVGQLAGAGNLAGVRRACLIAIAIALVFMSFSVLTMIFIGRQIAEFYLAGRAPTDLRAIALAISFLKIAAAFQVFDAIQVVCAFALRGLKDTRMPLILAAISYWLIGVPICLILAFNLQMQGFGIWIGLAIGLAVAAVLMSSRFYIMTSDRRFRAAVISEF